MRLLATCCAALALTAILSAPATPAAHAPESWTAPSYVPPLPRPLVLHRGFERPPQPWAAGHRGVDLLADVGATVRTPAPGTVSFAADVAGRGVVTIVHEDGLRSSVEPVAAAVDVGATVAGGEAVGVVEARSGHCAPSSCLHWGVRDAHGYVDPLLLLRGGPTVLLPGP